MKCTYTGKIDKMPFEGENVMAYNNARKVYSSTWIDNMGTGLMYMEATYDKGNKTITSKGKAYDIVTGKPYDLRETQTLVDDNTQEMEMLDIKNGKETKTMMIKMVRSR